MPCPGARGQWLVRIVRYCSADNRGMCRLAPHRSLDNLSRPPITVNRQSMLHFALHIQQQQQRSNWGNNFLTITSHLKTYDSNNNMSVFSRVYGLDMYLLYALLPVHRQHSLPIPYPDHPPFKLNVVLNQIVFVLTLSLTESKTIQNVMFSIHLES